MFGVGQNRRIMSDDDLDEIDDFDDVFSDEDIDGPDGVRTFSIAELADEINEDRKSTRLNSSHFVPYRMPSPP